MVCLPNNKNGIVTFVKLYQTENRETVHQVRTFVTISGDLVQGPSYNMVSIFDCDSNSGVLRPCSGHHRHQACGRYAYRHIKKIWQS